MSTLEKLGAERTYRTEGGRIVIISHLAGWSATVKRSGSNEWETFEVDKFALTLIQPETIAKLEARRQNDTA